MDRKRKTLSQTAVLFLSICTLIAALALGFTQASDALAQQNGNGGGGNAGGNGNGKSGGVNAGGNGAVNLSGGQPSNPQEKPAKSFTKLEISNAQTAVERSQRSYDKAITLAESTKKALLLALLDADGSLAVVKDIRRLVQSAKPSPRLANLLRNYEEALLESDKSLAHAYNNHVKALKLLEQSRTVLTRARANLKVSVRSHPPCLVLADKIEGT